MNIEVTKEVKSSRNSRFGGGGGFDPFFEFFGIPQGSFEQPQQPQQQRGGGSGVIISPDGYIVTNNHVVEDASEVKVTLNDNRTFTAKVIGTDPTTDVALVKIDPTCRIFRSGNRMRCASANGCLPSAAPMVCKAP